MFITKITSVAGCIGAAMLATAIAPAAFAASPDDQVTVKVSIADLNMSTEAGAKAALARINYAAREICGDNSGDKPSLSEHMQLRSCVTSIVAQTVASTNSPTLLAVSQGRHVDSTTFAAR